MELVLLQVQELFAHGFSSKDKNKSKITRSLWTVFLDMEAVIYDDSFIHSTVKMTWERSDSQEVRTRSKDS